MGMATAADNAVPLAESPTLDAILSVHARALGRDFEPYRNHAYRVANLCLAQSSPDSDQVEKVAIAAAFHDLGIWTACTFDYLEPSACLARDYLSRSGRPEWISEIVETITAHHKVLRYRGNDRWLVEPFRRADWMDVSLGVVSFGLSRTLFEAVVSNWPRAGLHKRLAHLELRRLRTHPWSPLPMVRL